MSIVSFVMALGMASFGVSSISGQVVAPKGVPVANAQVFMEAGVAAPLAQTATGADGAFRFDDVPNETVGVFAIAAGFGFGGATLQVASNTDIQGTKIQLAPPGKIGGKITDAKGHPVKGARVTRVALLGESKVGIPLAKLKSIVIPAKAGIQSTRQPSDAGHLDSRLRGNDDGSQAGFAEPVSDEKGRFSVENLPENATIALKIAHPDFAQEADDNIRVGDENVSITLVDGILLEGDVLSRDAQKPVAGVMVMIRNAQPPHDTATVNSDFQGHFSMRVKPGAYMCQVAGAGLASPGWEKITVKTDPAPKVKIYAAGMGKIEGKVCDAVTGKPVADAKIQLETEGNAAATARTGATGEYSVTAMAGANVVRLEPAPGYLTPEQPPLNFAVAEGKTVTLPTFWLAPIPHYSVLIVDGNDKPVPGAVVTVLSPHQFGWQAANAEGKVDLSFAAWPASGSVIGLAEHPREPLGALFALKKEQASGAKVQLFPLASVKGRAVSPQGKPVEGALVASVVGDEGIPLWRTVTAGDGTFRWESVVPQSPQQCVIATNAENHSEPLTFSVDIGGTKDLGDIAVPDASDKPSLVGKSLLVRNNSAPTCAWNKNPLIAGTLPDAATLRDSLALVIYCSAADAPMVVEALAAARNVCPAKKVTFAAVIDGAYDAKKPPVPVLSGKAPGPASTYVIDAGGKVVLETFGMPPLRAFQK